MSTGSSTSPSAEQGARMEPGRVRRSLVALAFLAVLLDGFDAAALAVVVPTLSREWQVPAASDRLPSKALTEAGGGRFAADPRDSNQLRTLARTFQFDLELPPDAAHSNFGSRVLVRFDHGREPMAAQWYRRLRQLFLSRFEA